MNHTLNQWIPWTLKSAAIAFDHCPNGVGRGEYKVAAELDAIVHGQNVSYDMDILLNGSLCQGEVKELDTDKSIRCGRNTRDAYRPIMGRIMTLLSIFEDVKDLTLLPPRLRPLLIHLARISPDEISQGNLKKLETTCAELATFREGLLAALPLVPLIDPITGDKRQVRADTFYHTALTSGAPHATVQKLLGPAVYPIVCMTTCLTHVYIQPTGQLMADLQGVRSVFRGYVLVLVDPLKGYYLMTSPEEKVWVYRVTSTSPRFRVPI